MACCASNKSSMPACCQTGGSEKLYEKLYLLEFMVIEVCYSCACTMDCKFLQSLGATCVCFIGDSFPVMTVCEDEFGMCAPFENFKVRFPSGKATLFAFKQGMESCISNKARLVVSRKLSGNCISVFKFGTAYLKLSPDFLSVLTSPCSCSKCLRVSLDIINDECKTVGSIAIFMRLSSFGTQITSQFPECPSTDSRFFSFRGDRFNLATFGSDGQANAGTYTQMCNQCQSVPDSCYQQMKAEMMYELVNLMRSDTALSYLLKDGSLPKADKFIRSLPMMYNPQASMIGNEINGVSNKNFDKLGINYYSQEPYNLGQFNSHVDGNVGFINRNQIFPLGIAYNQGDLFAGPPVNPMLGQCPINNPLQITSPTLIPELRNPFYAQMVDAKTPFALENKNQMKQESENVISRAKSR